MESSGGGDKSQSSSGRDSVLWAFGGNVWRKDGYRIRVWIADCLLILRVSHRLFVSLVSVVVVKLTVCVYEL